jgi:hypothetical protein
MPYTELLKDVLLFPLRCKYTIAKIKHAENALTTYTNLFRISNAFKHPYHAYS